MILQNPVYWFYCIAEVVFAIDFPLILAFLTKCDIIDMLYVFVGNPTHEQREYLERKVMYAC